MLTENEAFRATCFIYLIPIAFLIIAFVSSVSFGVFLIAVILYNFFEDDIRAGWEKRFLKYKTAISDQSIKKEEPSLRSNLKFIINNAVINILLVILGIKLLNDGNMWEGTLALIFFGYYSIAYIWVLIAALKESKIPRVVHK